MNRTTRAYIVRYRREAATVLAGLATLILVNALSPLHSARIVTAARSLPAGHVLTEADLRVQSSTVTWAGSFSGTEELVGRTTSRALTAGEPLSGSSLMGASLLQGQVRGRVAVAVPVTSADADLVHPGDIVDVLSAVERVADTASVIAVSATSNRAVGADSSRSVILAVYPREAEAIAAARSTGAFMLALQQR